MTTGDFWTAPAERKRGSPEPMQGRRPEPVRVSPRRIADIIATVARCWGLTTGHLRGACRLADVVRARKAAALALRRVGLSWPAVGEALWRNHSSSMQLVNHERLGALVLEEQDQRFRAAVAAGVAVR